MRKKINGGWLFKQGESAGAELPDFNDNSWEEIRVPHDWSIEGPFDKKNYMPKEMVANHLEGHADSYLPKGTGWYRRRLKINEISDIGITYIEFEGVFRNSTLWVNGKEAGRHPWGYTGFFYDITHLLSKEKDADMLAIYVDARKTEGWWYEGSGIYRHVWLISKKPLHIPPWGVFVRTPEVSEKEALIEIKTTISNRFPKEIKYKIITEILTPNGKIEASETKESSIEGNGNIDVLQNCTIKNPLLWSTESPHLYKARTYVFIGEEESDRIETTFGIRWFEFTSTDGFFLNGRPMQIRGGCIHHDFGGLGCALPDRANEKTVEVLKEMGCNIIRSAHNAAAPSLMDACDKHGMLFWAENRYYLEPVERVEQPLREMLQRDRNHPCIVVWGLANTAGSPDKKLTDYLKGLNEIVKSEDVSRPTAVALEGNDDANNNGFALVTDLVGYNGGGMGIDDRDHKLFPERKMIISEYSSARGARGIYEERPVKSKELSMEKGIEEFGDGRIMRRADKYSDIFKLCKGHETEWTHIDLRPWLSGGIMWSVIEYYGETGGWPFVTSQFGVIDICRFPKDTFYYYKKLWSDEPVLHIFPHWTWPGKEGRLIDIWCYTNCDEVRLYFNDEPIKGIAPFLQKGSSLPHFYWTVPYRSGKITAEGFIGGELICRQEVETAGKAYKLSATADREEILAGEEDLSFVTVGIHDAKGTLVPFAENEITVDINGEGRLIGLCSGDPCSHQSPKTKQMKAFNGLTLAIIQASGGAGKIDVECSSPGLKSCKIALETRENVKGL